GNYRVARLLGKGGMGLVYLGVQPDIGSRVAIKVITRAGAQDSADVQRFFAEARSVNLIQHDGIVSVLDLAYLPDGRPYIVMEYIDGASLSHWMRNGLGARRLLGMAIEMLAALAAAHAKGIVHRDLKPDNVMVTPEGRVKLLDFGIAKLRVEGEPTQHLTNTGAVIGTPTYMSPEQALARPIDARSDLYSFGILLYQGLVGHVPFKGNSLFELLNQHVTVPAPALAATRSDLPEALGALLARTLAKNPAERPQSALELRSQLLALLPQVPDNVPLAAGAVAHAAPPPAASHVSLSMQLPDAWRTGATYAPLAGQQAHQPSPERHSFGPGGPAWNAGVPSQPSAPQGGSRLPWFLVGVSGLLVVVFAVVAVAVVAIVVLRKPSASAQPPVVVTVNAPSDLAQRSPNAEAPQMPAPDMAAADMPQPESAAAAATPRALPGGTHANQNPGAPQAASPAPTPAPTPTSAAAAEPAQTATADRGLEAIRKLQAAAKEPGTVKIDSKPPGASVVFDGKSKGKAPINMTNVTHGDYDVTCTLEGHRPRTYLIHVRAGTTSLLCEMLIELKIPTKL
ncbi:MAG TPA: serine/threonine-protein kinase, partial [Polyangiaceae bacterium]|nr:serine/threonine-protein kinase [Polyangiaceae bacterium]